MFGCRQGTPTRNHNLCSMEQPLRTRIAPASHEAGASPVRPRPTTPPGTRSVTGRCGCGLHGGPRFARVAPSGA